MSDCLFNFKKGYTFDRRYQIDCFLGYGWEGEVYKVIETQTRVFRAVKFFYEHAQAAQTHISYAQKLHALKDCSIVIQYHNHGTIRVKGATVHYLVSDYADGEVLLDYLHRQKNQSIPIFTSLHLIYKLACGINEIHKKRYYHGDIHLENILIKQFGVGFNIYLIDFFHLGASTKKNQQEDLIDLMRLFYDLIGGVRYYNKLPPQIKELVNGKKRSLILKKIGSIQSLVGMMENLLWD